MRSERFAWGFKLIGRPISVIWMESKGTLFPLSQAARGVAPSLIEGEAQRRGYRCSLTVPLDFFAFLCDVHAY